MSVTSDVQRPAAHYDPVSGQPFLIYSMPYNPVVNFFYENQLIASPADMGIPAEVLERFKNFPKSVRLVFDTSDLFVLLCKYCCEFKNIEYYKDGSHKLVAAFCGSCVTILSHAETYACACGKPRHLDPLAKPSGKVCSECHQSARRDAPQQKKKKKKKGRGGRRV